jgi:hypothetical protein
VITAVDTNVLLDVLRPNPDFLDASLEALVTFGGEGKLVICDIVYAELCVHFPDRKSCDGSCGTARLACKHSPGQPAILPPVLGRNTERREGLGSESSRTS